MDTKKEAALSQADVESTINSCVDSILKALEDKGLTKEWNKSAHVSLIVRLAIDSGLPKESAKDFAQMLAESGVGGNQSQFLQSKFLKGKLAKKETRKTMVDLY